MANKKQGPMLIVLVAVIAVALFFIVREVRPPEPHPPLMANWACLECGYEFVAPLPAGPFDLIRCPRDEGETAQIRYYKCGICGLRFEAYRLKAEAMAILFQVPGGAWVRGEEEPRVVCPGGCGDPEALRYSPPES